MRRPGGTLIGSREGVTTEEHDTFSCAHCGAVCILRAGVDPTADGSILCKQPHWQSDGMGVCLMCAGTDRGLICPACHAIQNKQGGCRNFERRMEKAERAARLRAQI